MPCEKCPLKGRPKVPSLKIGSPQIAFVGEAPGYEEAKAGRPFVEDAPAGGLLKAILNELGITECFLTNAVLCRPDKNKKPSIKAIRCCRERLLSALSNYPLVILLGEIAFKATFPEFSFKFYRGAVKKVVGGVVCPIYNYAKITPSYYAQVVIPTYHPAAALHQQSEGIARIIERHIELGMELAYLRKPRHITTDGLPNWTSVDIETSNGEVVCASECHSNLNICTSFPPMKICLSNVYGHNIKYDYKELKKAGYIADSPVSLLDTMLLAYILDESFPETSLKALATFYTDVYYTFKDIATREKLIKGEPVDKGDLMEYNIKDATATFKLANKLNEILHLDRPSITWNLYMKLCNTIPLIADMELYGIKVDRGILQDKWTECMSSVHALENKHGDLIRSPLRLAKHLGVSTTAKESLRLVKGELAKDVLVFRQWSKAASVIDNLAKSADNDGIIHPDFILGKTYDDKGGESGTVTGRLACQNPNLQNIARPGGIIELREAFVTRPGYTFIELDFNQAELRVLAWLSEDPKMLEAYHRGKDLHQQTMDLLHLSRPIAKSTNFGIVYGISAVGLARNLGISVEEARKIIGRWYSTYTVVKDYHTALVQKASENGYLETPLGRRRHFNFSDYDKARRQAINFPVQSVAGDLMTLFGIPAVYATKKDTWHPILVVHDSILVEVPDEDVADATVVLRNTLTDAVATALHHKIPILVDVKTGKDWGHLTPWNFLLK